jgi:hypothetical protein
MNTYHQLETNRNMADKSSIATYIGGFISAFWGIATSQEFGIFIGMLMSAVGLCLTYFYKRREDKYKQADERRKQEIHEITMQNLRNNGG